MKKVICLIFVMLIFSPFVFAQTNQGGGFWSSFFGLTNLGSNNNLDPHTYEEGLPSEAAQQAQERVGINLAESRYCTDSDDYFKEGKWAFHIKGIVEASLYDEELRFSDKCIDNYNLREYYCGEDGSIKQIKVYCPNGCTDGLCEEPPFCVDTDKGKNLGVQGRLHLLLKENAEIERKEDFCLDDDRTLVQFSCSDNPEGFIKEEHDCEYGCKGGVCLEPELEDDSEGDSDSTSPGFEVQSAPDLGGLLDVSSEEDNTIVIKEGEHKMINGVKVSVSENLDTIVQEFNVVEYSEYQDFQFR